MARHGVRELDHDGAPAPAGWDGGRRYGQVDPRPARYPGRDLPAARPGPEAPRSGVRTAWGTGRARPVRTPRALLGGPQAREDPTTTFEGPTPGPRRRSRTVEPPAPRGGDGTRRSGARAGLSSRAPVAKTGRAQYASTGAGGAAQRDEAYEPATWAGEPAVSSKLADAARAYAADRYQDALRILRRLSAQAPSSSAVKELLGLTLYRLGRWPLALRELESHRQLSGSYDQYPVIADCYRAMRQYADADAIWLELRQASPGPELLAEGRLVAAGCLADQGDLRGAVSLLETALRRSKPRPSHLRQWYALADLYERAGELPRARELFAQIASVDPDAYDVKQRLVALD